MAKLGHRHLVKNVRHPRLTWRYGKWRFIDNLARVFTYYRNKAPLTPRQSTLLKGLDRDGLALTSAQDLLGSPSDYDELTKAVENLETEMAAEICQARARACSELSYKSFVLQLLGDRPCLDTENVFLRFALEKNILGIVNAYFGMNACLKSYNVWHNFVSGRPPAESQFWHRDPEDNQILKVFLYLSDVDEGSGPFTYAARTHLKGELFWRQPEYTRKKGDAKRSDDEQMAKVVSHENWTKCLGPKGTMIFADTRGYHKGGFAVDRERILYTFMFTSHAAKCAESFYRSSRLVIPQDREQALAITSP